VLLGTILVQFREHAGHTPMGFREIRIDGERQLIMFLRSGEIALLAQHIGEIDVSDRIDRMMLHRL